MKNEILIRDNFVTEEDCRSIIGAFTRCRASCTHKIGDGFFDHRVMWASSYPANEDRARNILRQWCTESTKLVAGFFEEPVIYCDGLQTVIWEGQAMPPHQDDRHPNPAEPHGTPWRFLASVIYLNDDYDGGEIYFPGIRGPGSISPMTIKPRRGQLIAFPGAWWHGVNAVTKGARITCPAWYSRNRANEDVFLR